MAACLRPCKLILLMLFLTFWPLLGPGQSFEGSYRPSLGPRGRGRRIKSLDMATKTGNSDHVGALDSTVPNDDILFHVTL